MGENVKFSNCNLMIRDSNGEFQELIIDNLGNMSITFENNENAINSKDVDINSEASLTIDGKLEEEILDKLCAIDLHELAYSDSNNIISYETKCEIAPELKEEIDNRIDKEINKRWKGYWNTLWRELDNDIKYTSKSPIAADEIEKVIKNNNNRHKDSLTALCYGLEGIQRHLDKSSESLEKFAEKSKLVYDKEKEKKEEEMEKSTFALPIVGVRFQGSSKTYAYFVTKEVLETYFKYINDYCAVTNQHLPYVTITNEVDYNYKSSKVMFIGLAKTPMALNCPTHIITKINYAFSCAINPYELGQGTNDFCSFEKCKLAGKDWFERISVRPVPEMLCKEYFNSNTTLRAYNNTDEIKIENKGDNKMNFNKIFPNAEIGKATNVKMSIYGPAFGTVDQREIAFKDGEWVDVTGFTFDFAPAFVCPVKAADVVVGDFIKHLTTWCRVINIDNGTITAENIFVHEVITILPVKSMFGFDFYSKLILPFGDFSSDIGDMFSNPFMTMMLFGGDSKDFNDMLPLMLMSGGKFDMSNPMMLYFLMKENKGDSTGRTTGRELCF